ncbi:three-Cys-motif partner protein TcmP [Bradyrhizobium sp. 83002]|uniref:three-Cys-motif partner protein TcmP n=1 Tax=Bradyrhizobium aeschynomenes TaxID=2734909 RepID=UPI0015583464|nr:three-Cys-motif partner protein TcmP [Bradyrhizobium aeschynomenes]NPU13248.1 three-Cys-motif partner protein TcmP [Bradyrhizobium aeschynomenes]
MVAIEDYLGREQAYVKHVFLELYLERLVHKTASRFDHIVYVDGFAGPWLSANEDFLDTSFGIALNALRKAKATWKAAGRDVRMSAYLVEKDKNAYERLNGIGHRFPDILVKTYPQDFLNALPTILTDIPTTAFTFFFVDPKGWRFRLHDLATMLKRSHSEVVFNFMFDFINRAASMKEPTIEQGVDELIPFGDWRAKLEDAEQRGPSSEDRKRILVDAFGESLATIGAYTYVAETTVLRPVSDRALYCLCYATRHSEGIKTFRDCQIKVLEEEAKTRATTKIKRAEAVSGQREIFESLHDMAPNDLERKLELARTAAEAAFLELVPRDPALIRFDEVWPHVLSRHILRLKDINEIAARLRKEGKLIFLDWEARKRVPDGYYRMQRS